MFTVFKIEYTCTCDIKYKTKANGSIYNYRMFSHKF